jgi:hypothetical protein
MATATAARPARRSAAKATKAPKATKETKRKPAAPKPEAAPAASAAKEKKTTKKKEPKQCWCGCGGESKNRFAPGHDMRLKGKALRCARGVNGWHTDEVSESLPHDDARDFFSAHVLAERTKLAAAKK